MASFEKKYLALWLKALSGIGVDKHSRGSFGYAQDGPFDSALRALCHAINLWWRSAQDDDFVASLEKNTLALWLKAPSGMG